MDLPRIGWADGFELESKNVRISPSAGGHFACFCRLTPYSAKTYEFPARRTRVEKRVSCRGVLKRHLSVD
jgi:hypothetical protein